MSSIVLTPALEPEVELRDVGGGLLLRHRRYETQLHVTGEDRLAVKAMDGTRTLEDIEEVLAPQEGTLGYQSLVMLLFRLWDRGLLADGEVYKSELFAHQTSRTLDRALAARRLRWLVTVAALRDVPSRALGLIAPLGRVFVSDAFLALTGALLGVALLFELAGVTPWPRHLFFLDGSWVTGILVFYGGLVGSMSLRGLVRAAVLAGPGRCAPRFGLRVTCGIAYLDADDTLAYHLDRGLQLRFALVGLFVLGGLAGVLLQVAVFHAEPWRHLGAAALLAAFADLCPFLPTDGARLSELLSGIHRQRFRVRSFLARRFLKGGFEARAGEVVRLTIATVVWIAWFLAALRLVTFLILNDLIPLEAAIATGHSLVLAIVGGAFFVALLLLVAAIVLTVLFVAGAFVVQLLTPQRVHRPKEQVSAEALADSSEVEAHLTELPVTRSLPAAAVAELVARVEVLRYPKGACLRRAGGEDYRIIWVLDGQVELRSPLTEGGHTLVAVMGPGDHFGDEALTGSRCRHDAVAREDVRLMAMAGDALRDLSALAAEDTEAMARSFELARFLDAVPEMAGLSPSARLELALHVKELELPAGHAVIREGDPSPTMYLVRSGRCVVTRRAADGADEFLAYIKESGTFGEVGLLFDKPRSATVACVEPCALVEVPKEALNRAMRESFHVGLALERLASARVEGGAR